MSMAGPFFMDGIRVLVHISSNPQLAPYFLPNYLVPWISNATTEYF